MIMQMWLQIRRQLLVILRGVQHEVSTPKQMFTMSLPLAQLHNSNDTCPRVGRVPPSHPGDLLLTDVLDGISHAAEMELENKVRCGGACLPGESSKTPSPCKGWWKSPEAF